MFRWLRRWWARMCHKHEWVVIYRDRVVCEYKFLSDSPIEKREPIVLERCHCGLERARQWDGRSWKHLDLDWLNDQLIRADIDIPARHQE